MSEKYPYDDKTREIIRLIDNKGPIPFKGVVKAVLDNCPAWSDYKDVDPRGAGMSIGRRLSIMERDGYIRKRMVDGREMWVR